jgi:hypothetical protein
MRRPHITGRISSFGRTTCTPFRFLWRGCSKRLVRGVSISVRMVAVDLDHGFDGGKRIRHVHSPRNVQDERTRHDACQIELYPHIESRDVDSSDVSCPLTSAHDEGAAVQCTEPPTCSAAPRAGENLSSSGHDSTSRRVARQPWGCGKRASAPHFTYSRCRVKRNDMRRRLNDRAIVREPLQCRQIFFCITRVSTAVPHHVHIICTCFPQYQRRYIVTHVVV